MNERSEVEWTDLNKYVNEGELEKNRKKKNNKIIIITMEK